MKNHSNAKRVAASLVLLSLAACTRHESTSRQGYLEGEYIYVAAPLGGQLEKLAVARGTQVAAGDPLFTLESGAESAALQEAAGRLRQVQARLADLRKGQRPSELAALEARLDQAGTAAELSALELERSTRLHDTTVMSDGDFDRIRLQHEVNARRVEEVQAQLDTARLGGRADVVAAAEAEVTAARATLDRAGWSVAQKRLTAPRAALVFDTLYREGEFVPAGTPVVTLLPPDFIKVRFFVPEAEFGALKAGGIVHISLAGHPNPLTARISYLSPAPEYTPPVLYNRENRSKLVFMIEAVFDPVVPDLHPGQPVDVTVVP